MSRLKCIIPSVSGLVFGHEYTVIKSKGELVKVMNDQGQFQWYSRARFETAGESAVESE